MASPSKAFIDATTLSTFYQGRVTSPAVSLRVPNATVAVQPWISNPWSLVIQGSKGLMSGSVFANINAKIPPPPMGRMLFATFPPIYKERPKDQVDVRDPAVFWVTPIIDNVNNLPDSDVYQAESFDIFNYLPMLYREADESDGSLANFGWAFNQIWAELLYEAASMPTNIIFSSSTRLIAELCAHRGNPFTFLNETQLRRAADNLIHIYKRRGDREGMIHVIWFLLGIQVVLSMDYEYCWRLGTARLGIDTILSSSESPMFKVTVPYGTSDDLVEQIKIIVHFMKPANLYYRVEVAAGL